MIPCENDNKTEWGSLYTAVGLWRLDEVRLLIWVRSRKRLTISFWEPRERRDMCDNPVTCTSCILRRTGQALPWRPKNAHKIIYPHGDKKLAQATVSAGRRVGVPRGRSSRWMAGFEDTVHLACKGREFCQEARAHRCTYCIHGWQALFPQPRTGKSIVASV